jgi:hypothetical protein
MLKAHPPIEGELRRLGASHARLESLPATSLRQATKPLLDEQKRQGLIMDYKVFLKETQEGPHDWDIALAVQYKNHAAMDGLTAKNEAIRDKIMGGKQAQQVTEKRTEIREVVSSELLQEIMLK